MLTEYQVNNLHSFIEVINDNKPGGDTD